MGNDTVPGEEYPESARRVSGECPKGDGLMTPLSRSRIEQMNRGRKSYGEEGYAGIG